MATAQLLVIIIIIIIIITMSMSAEIRTPIAFLLFTAYFLSLCAPCSMQQWANIDSTAPSFLTLTGAEPLVKIKKRLVLNDGKKKRREEKWAVTCFFLQSL